MADHAPTQHTIVLTFDNLGQAAELQRGTWPAHAAPGSHPSLTVALPRLLAELQTLQLRATFFAEAINCELNPDAVRAIADHGHELGIHGWRHETWAEVGPARERELLQRAAQAYRDLGITPVAFRPPGGAVHPDTPALLRELGLRWVSVRATHFAADADGFGWIPFRWELVDAYLRMDRFAQLRQEHGDPETALPAMTAGQRLVGELAGSTGPQTLVLHPHLLADDAWWEQGRRILGWLARWRDAGEAAVLTGSELTERLAAPR